MSDYGFVTYDEKNPKKRLGTINSKWPIFGPKYVDISRAFKTIHINDTYSPPYKTGTDTPTIPSGGYYASTEKRWHEKQLIHQFEHGYNFRPVGYAVFSGDLVVNVKCTITQTEVITGNTSPYGGNFTLDGLATQSIPILPAVRGQMTASYISTGQSPSELSLGDYFFGIQDISGNGGARKDIRVPDSCIGLIKSDYTVAGFYSGGADMPYVVEIDEKYVKIYRNTYWLDFWLKYYSSYYNASYPQFNFTHSIDDRIKGATSYAGTSIDCTVYLAPYSMEELI